MGQGIGQCCREKCCNDLGDGQFDDITSNDSAQDAYIPNLVPSMSVLPPSKCAPSQSSKINGDRTEVYGQWCRAAVPDVQSAVKACASPRLNGLPDAQDGPGMRLVTPWCVANESLVGAPNQSNHWQQADEKEARGTCGSGGGRGTNGASACDGLQPRVLSRVAPTA